MTSANHVINKTGDNMRKWSFNPPENFRFQTFPNLDGKKVRFGVGQAPHRPARGSVLLCPGWTEFIEKYFPIIVQLNGLGFDVLTIDWPGQGASERFLRDPLKGYIDDFSTFTSALKIAIDEAGDLPRPYIMLAHSMGGAIGLTALIEGKVHVDAALFSTPLWGFKRKIPAGMLVINLLNMIGLGKTYVGKPKGPGTLADSNVTQSQHEFDRMRALERAFPDQCLAEPSWAWVKAAASAMNNFDAKGVVEKIDCPVLVTKAENELLVDNLAISRLASRFPDVEIKTFDRAKHELMFERTVTRAIFWHAFDRLLDRAGI